MDLKTLTSLGRFKEIVMILMKYGFEDLIDRLDMPGLKLIKRISRMDQGMGTFERIRHALEELGPTFVKFGQIMSLRPDLLPPRLIDELSRLQDDVAPVDISEIQEVVEEGTGRPLLETFSVFDATPLAAASISQVHRGALKKDGRIAGIKVQRPGIRSKMNTDLDILAMVAGRVHERMDELKSFDLPNLIQLIKRTLLRELDFKREALNMKIARSYAGEASEIYIPEVYEEYCTERILVMEYIQGSKLKDVTTATLSDPASLARQGLRAAIHQILEDGFFHADPHPGNVLITEDERICLVDWGMTGRLSERDRHRLIYLLKSVLDKDGEAMVHALLRIGHAEASIDQRALERELLDIVDSHFAVPVKDMNIGRLLMEITELLRTYRLGLPPDLVIMIKALVTAEGTARHIYPDLNVFVEAKEYISNLAIERFSPESLWRSLRFAASQFLSIQKELPNRLESILSKADRGELTLGFRHENLAGLRNTLDNITNRLTFGIIISAMIIGSSMIITTGIGPLLFGFPALGVIGYLISGVLGLWLVFNIIRKRKY
jgi:ubiquinone biosynthesis protein